jgi:hypothetical protein
MAWYFYMAQFAQHKAFKAGFKKARKPCRKPNTKAPAKRPRCFAKKSFRLLVYSERK